MHKPIELIELATGKWALVRLGLFARSLVNVCAHEQQSQPWRVSPSGLVERLAVGHDDMTALGAG